MKNHLKEIIKSGSSIIDIGAEDLYLSKAIQTETNCNVTGIDVKDCGNSNFDLIINNKIPFKNNAFDYAIFNCVLHHIPKEQQRIIIKEAKRVAKDLIIFDDKKGIWILIDSILNNQPIKTFGHRLLIDWKILFNRLGMQFVAYDIHKPLFYPIQHYLFTSK